ncbi:hypothetical protein SR870_16995 [Rhodopseudomonas palustris]|uniref:hypothetical protein n=1 Tax=Rhodopseudomonas palustris TaxID=1076 RepID=UPI002ACD28A4|nr:hypothetical protein [Rhodopseudomonas palustris]WQG98388.1 hypothetical protein SR870_16995 [Rhodopseudomonas palustris]
MRNVNAPTPPALRNDMPLEEIAQISDLKSMALALFFSTSLSPTSSLAVFLAAKVNCPAAAPWGTNVQARLAEMVSRGSKKPWRRKQPGVPFDTQPNLFMVLADFEAELSKVAAESDIDTQSENQSASAET